MSDRKNALGKGLGALLGTSRPVSITPPVVPPPSAKEKSPFGKPTAPQPTKGKAIPEAPAAIPVADLATADIKSVRYLKLSLIATNPYQPRKRFSQESLQELAESIRTRGILQPILVMKDKKGPGYTLIAGERRFRAAMIAELEQVPALVTEVTDEEMLEIAVVENVQREDLNPVEEARGYRQLVDKFGWSQEQVARRVGKQRTTVANALRLLKLSDDTLTDIETGRMTAGHARALLALDDAFQRQKLRQEIVDQAISVREAEKRVLLYQKPDKPRPPSKSGKKSLSNKLEKLDMVALQEGLMAHLGCRVRLVSRDGLAGTLEIPFGNPEELQRFLDAIGYEAE